MLIIDHISLTSIQLSDSIAVVRLNNNIASEIKCEICQREFKYNKVYKRHKKSHQNNKKFKEYSCKRCSKRFRGKVLIERHVQIHSKNREQVKKVNAIKSIINQNCGDNEPVIDNTNDFCLICNRKIDYYSNNKLNRELLTFKKKF